MTESFGIWDMGLMVSYPYILAKWSISHHALSIQSFRFILFHINKLKTFSIYLDRKHKGIF